MKRRTFLVGVGVSLGVGSAGCLSETGSSSADGSEREASPESGGTAETSATTVAEPETTATPDPSDPILIVVSNERAETRTVHLVVSAGDRSIFEDSVTVGSRESRTVDPGITETGQYELTVTVDDGSAGTRSYPFDVGEYELQTGSNLIVEIGEGEINLLIEE